MKIKLLTDFIIERYKIYLRRQANQPPPWTKDPIMQRYKFTNIRREDDRVTRWIAKHWRTPHQHDPHLWFAMVVARYVNKPDTLQHLSLPGRWNKRQFLKVMQAQKSAGHTAFGGAYIVTSLGRTGNKAIAIADFIFDPLWEQRAYYAPRNTDTLESFHARLMEAKGMGSFMSAQIVADMKYVEPLKNAKDWWTFAASGPGSRRGLNYVIGSDPSQHWKEDEWRLSLIEVSSIVKPILKNAGVPRLHNQDLQNCLCEFSKWMRAKLGTGRPKTRFVPYENTHQEELVL
jgi:hypothetical protein